MHVSCSVSHVSEDTGVSRKDPWICTVTLSVDKDNDPVCCARYWGRCVISVEVPPHVQRSDGDFSSVASGGSIPFRDEEEVVCRAVGDEISSEGSTCCVDKLEVDEL